MKKVLISTFLVLTLGAFPAFSEEITGDILGKQRRHVHPAASLSFQYTDNLYNSDKDRESDFSTIFSPSIALSLPGSRSVDIVMASDTGAPGGLGLSRDSLDATDRYLMYLIYNPKAELYADNSDENLTSHTVKAAAQYNAPGGLSVDLAGKFATASEVRGEVGNRALDEYEDMLYDLILRYDFSPRLFVRGSLSGYKLEYDKKISAFRNRTDFSWSMSAGYKMTARTEVAFEYQRATMDYDDPADLGGTRYYHDNEEDRISANLAWNITSKSRGKLKVGQIRKSMDRGDDDTELFAELHLAHHFTTRSRLQAAVSRRFYEANFGAADFYVSDRIGLLYSQDLTARITGKLGVDWNSDSYSGVRMENDIYRVNPACAYNFNDWLSMEVGYSYEKRTSTYAFLEYDTNRFYFSIMGQF